MPRNLNGIGTEVTWLEYTQPLWEDLLRKQQGATNKSRTLECNTMKAIIAEFADCFVLSIKEVNAIPGAMHKLNIPEDTTFKTKIPPRSYNLDQRAFMEMKIDGMLEAGVICRIHPRDVRFIAQMVLAQKTHEGEGLKYWVNSQCIEHGLPSKFEMPPQLDAPRPNTNAMQNTPKT